MAGADKTQRYTLLRFVALKGLSMRVLVVEDDQALGLFLQKGLRFEGHEVEWVGDGESVLERAPRLSPDLVVLDLRLPGMGGIAVLEAMQALMERTAVLVLTGSSRIEERVRCLELGADDVVLKPFSFHELVARCSAILRRRDRYADPVLRAMGLELNRMDRTVRLAGVPIELTSKEFQLLEFLMRRKGACCGREELLCELWQAAAPGAGTNIVDVYVTYLRKKLAAAAGEEGQGMSLIETVRGSGYRIRLDEVVMELPVQMELPVMALARGA